MSVYIYTYIHPYLYIYSYTDDQKVVEAVKKIEDLHENVLKVQSVAADLPSLILRYMLYVCIFV
jgi:hypothetical protein